VGAIADHKPEGNDVILYAAHATDKGVLADTAKLLKRRTATENHIVFNRAVTGEHDIVGEDHIVADLRVVSHMRSGQKSAMVADTGHHTAARRAGVHGHIFADDVVGADLERAFLALEFQVLRRMTDRRERIDFGSRPNRRVTLDDDMAVQNDIVVQPRMRPDDAIGANAHIGTDAGCRIDDRRGVNIAHYAFA